MGRILTVLTILSPVKEEVILSKISSLKNNFIPSSVFENVVITPDPLNVTNSADFFQYLSPEKILILFIFRTLSLATKKCTLLIEEEAHVFFVEELSIFMMFCLHNFQSGKTYFGNSKPTQCFGHSFERFLFSIETFSI